MKPLVSNQRDFRPMNLPRPRLRLMPRLADALPGITLVLAFTVLFWVSVQQLSTPAVVPASAPATEFSAARAMEHLRVIASEPRDVGSPGHAAARAYLVEQAESLGLTAEVQTTTVLVTAEEGAEGFGAANVHNVVVRIPGTASTGAIAINAHYDSGATGPGAGDAGSGVVTLLETMRALLAGPTLQNDLLFIFSDAEEVGMLGAAAFNQQHPLAAEVRLAINFEAQGSGGPALLYATGEDNGWLVGEYLDIAPNPSAYSLLPAISKLLPTARLGCDLEEYTNRGTAGLGFVFTADTSAYHTVRDNVTVIDPGSIQQEGDNTLAIVQHFGNIDLAAEHQAGDRVFFNIYSGVVVHYPAGYVIPLAGLITLLVAALLVVGFRRGQLTVAGLMVGTIAFTLGTLFSVVLAALAWFLTRTFNADYQVMLIGSYQSTLYAVALAFLTLAMMATLYTLLRRRVRPLNLMTGVLVGWLPLLWLVSIAMPGMSYLATWPVLFGLLPVGWSLLVGRHATQPWLRVAVLTLAAIPVIVLLPGTMHQILALFNRFEGITAMPLFGLSMLFVVPVIGLLVPHLGGESGSDSWRQWLVPAGAALIAVMLLGWGNITSDYDADQPRPNRIAYALDADTGNAQWISADQRLDAWTSLFFPTGSQRGEYDSVLMGAIPAFTAPAPTAELAGPEITVVNDTVVDGQRTLRLHLRSANGARMMAVDVDAPGEVTALSVDRQVADLVDAGWARDGSFLIAYQSVPDAGWQLDLTVASTEPITLVVEETTNGLPEIEGLTIEARPADMMPAPWHALDPTIVKQTFRY